MEKRGNDSLMMGPTWCKGQNRSGKEGSEPKGDIRIARKLWQRNRAEESCYLSQMNLKYVVVGKNMKLQKMILSRRKRCLFVP